jgi:protein-L-isoaspartate(D-aspartate) O-methyltransferase
MVDFSHARRAMVDGQLRTNDVTRSDILDVFSLIPRELFVDPSEQSIAYADRAVLSIGGKSRKILSPMNLARMIQATELKPDDAILDIAAGAGYSTAIMAGLGARVSLLENDSMQCLAAKQVLDGLDLQGVDIKEGDLTTSGADNAHYDVILINGRCEQGPHTLFQRLKDGGRLVAIVGISVASEVRVYTLNDGSIGEKRLMNASGPLLSEFIKAQTFVF